MSTFPLFAPVPEEAPAPRARLRAPELSAEISRARPELAADSPEHRAAVLLLLLPHVGRNVDRLVARTGYPRELVARCLRRLADNAWWVEGEAQCTWGEEPLADRHFWLDVEVALGRCLRRVGEAGTPEWAPVGEWLKAFEYRGPNSGGDAVHNQYRQVELHDPDPVLPSEVEDEEPEEEAAPPPRRPAQPRAARQPIRQSPPLAVNWLGGQPERQGTPVEVAGTPASPASPAFLVDEWTGADWLK